MWVWVAVSLLLGAAWPATRFGIAGLVVPAFGADWSVAAARGGLAFNRVDALYGGSSAPRLAGPWYRAIPAKDRRWPWIPLPRWERDTDRSGRTLDVVRVPIWMLLIPSLGMAARLWRASRAPEVGRCPSCRYDLSGNASGACPECGAAAVRS